MTSRYYFAEHKDGTLKNRARICDHKDVLARKWVPLIKLKWVTTCIENENSERGLRFHTSSTFMIRYASEFLKQLQVN